MYRYVLKSTTFKKWGGLVFPCFTSYSIDRLLARMATESSPGEGINISNLLFCFIFISRRHFAVSAIVEPLVCPELVISVVRISIFDEGVPNISECILYHNGSLRSHPIDPGSGR